MLKALYHAEPEQRLLQKRDIDEGGDRKFRDGMHSRWELDMERKLGSKAIWECVAFTGDLSPEFMNRVTASQRDVAPDVDAEVEGQKTRAAAAMKCRGTIRWAENLKKEQKNQRAKLSPENVQLIADLDSGKLRNDANNAVRDCGHGRIRSRDGTDIDLDKERGSRTRTACE